MNKPTFNKANSRNSRYQPKIQVNAHALNREITVPSVRVIGEGVEQSGTVMPTIDAIRLAEKLGVDLVLVTPKAEPPICRITDYKKFLFDQSKKEKELLKKQKETSKDQKEIRFTSNIAANDIDTKKKKVVEFLKDGHRVKVVVRFEGRNIVHKDRGEIILLKLAEELAPISRPDTLPKMVDRAMHIILMPNK